MEYCVQKFGGSSAAEPARIAEVFTAEPERNRVAVMSAVGAKKSDSTDIKCTDILKDLEAAVGRHDKRAISECQEAFIDKNLSAYGMLGEKVLSEMTDAAYNLMHPGNARQGYTWIGEHISARMFAELTGAAFMTTGLSFRGRDLDVAKSQEAIAESVYPYVKDGRQVVTEGFFGYETGKDKIRTLPRGGSDISGVIVTSAMALSDPENAWVNENCTDEDGIKSAHPGLVPAAQNIPEATFDEIREMMHGVSGRNGVIHGDAIAYAAALNVPIIVKNSLGQSGVSTRIVGLREPTPEQPVVAVSGEGNLTSIDIYDMGMADAVDYTAPILSKISKEGVSVSDYPTGKDHLKLIINGGASERKLNKICAFIRERAISGKSAAVEVVQNEGAVYLVGQELTNPHQITRAIGRAASAMGAAGLAMRSIISLEKAPSIMFTLDGDSVNNAVRVLHREFIEGNPTQP